MYLRQAPSQYEHAHRYGVLDTSDWSLFNYHNPVFVPWGLTRDTLHAKYRAFYRRFYLRPRIIWRYLRSFLGPTGLKRLPRLLSASRFLFQNRASHPTRQDSQTAQSRPHPCLFHRTNHTSRGARGTSPVNLTRDSAML